MTTQLTKHCDRCEDGIIWKSRYGGNDPDTWRVGPCDNCEGTGVVTLFCDCCDTPAIAELDGTLVCREHFLEFSEDDKEDFQAQPTLEFDAIMGVRNATS